MQFGIAARMSNAFAASLLFPAIAAQNFAAERPARADDEKLAANSWALLHRETGEGGKTFARAVHAENVDRLYLWGIGGKKPARNVYLRYELEAIDLASLLVKQGSGEVIWRPAFPAARRDEWTAEDYPPFRIWGQSGPDGLHYDEGPRLQTVGGYHHTNRIRWWDFDGVKRPSPVHTFNMACWDSKRNRILYYSDGCTFALDPKTNSWSDLQPENHPATCRSVAWASMCYDPAGDRVMLFGGGLGTNPLAGAPTWFYDCGQNKWYRPELEIEPPLRCNAPIVYDAATRSMVLFGGFNQAAALNDTWVFDCEQNEWQPRKPKLAPPPMYQPAAASLPGEPGKILVCGNDARRVKLHHQATSSADKETWVYDVADNTWTPIDNRLRLVGYPWLTAAPSEKHGVVLLVAFGPDRRTFAFRYDASCPVLDKEGAGEVESDLRDVPTGAPPGTIAWKYPEQKESLENAPAPNPEKHEKFLETLPANEFVDAKPPGLLISKTWSTAVMDTDASEMIYTGGGHSGYSGNDFARYSIAKNRWSLDQPPRFPPFLEGTNAGIFGWSYGMMPFSQHTYLWYCHDPASKTVVYLARPSIPDGTEVQLTDDEKDVFVYDSQKHGYATWVYDVADKQMHRPSFGRPFKNQWHLTVIGTPEGVYCAVNNELHYAKVNRQSGEVKWTLIDDEFPKPRDQIKYHYEFQPLLHDTQRDRLVQLKGDKNRVDVYARPLKEDAAWEQMKTTGEAAIGREAVYIARHDTILWLGDRLFALDCATNEMRQLDVELPEGRYGHECSFDYDPQHDVCVALIPSSFTGPMQTFLFRFDPSDGK